MAATKGIGRRLCRSRGRHWPRLRVEWRRSASRQVPGARHLLAPSTTSPENSADPPNFVLNFQRDKSPSTLQSAVGLHQTMGVNIEATPLPARHAAASRRDRALSSSLVTLLTRGLHGPGIPPQLPGEQDGQGSWKPAPALRVVAMPGWKGMLVVALQPAMLIFADPRPFVAHGTQQQARRSETRDIPNQQKMTSRDPYTPP